MRISGESTLFSLGRKTQRYMGIWGGYASPITQNILLLNFLFPHQCHTFYVRGFVKLWILFSWNLYTVTKKSFCGFSGGFLFPWMTRHKFMLYFGSWIFPKHPMLKPWSPAWCYWEVLEPLKGGSLAGELWEVHPQRQYGTPVSSFSFIIPLHLT